MSSPILRAAGALLLALASTSCYSVEHFPGDQKVYDGLYFGRDVDVPLSPSLHAEKWRNYAVWGLVPWDDEQIRFAGRRLAEVDTDKRPMMITVTSEQNLVNGLVSFGLGALTGPIGALIYVPRNVEVDGWYAK